MSFEKFKAMMGLVLAHKVRLTFLHIRWGCSVVFDQVEIITQECSFVHLCGLRNLIFNADMSEYKLVKV